jgi:Tannase and feruloyl esterase
MTYIDPPNPTREDPVISRPAPRAARAALATALTTALALAVAPTAQAQVAHCEVQAYVAPNIGFELRLPARDWNGKFAQVGCGGFCGGIFPTACDAVLGRGYACVATDMGHKSTALDAQWAYDNLQAEVDFAYRATHVVTLAGKAITARYFGRGPQRAYFVGCSTGGRQGMVEAQRFPWDYDGIVSGAPVINETGDGMALLWNVVSTHDREGKPLLSAGDLERVHAAAVAHCDLDDGVRDGLIGDPRRCAFDPGALACAAGATGDCLSAAQAEAVRKVYSGPVDSQRRALYTGGALPGSELNWIGNYVARDGGRSTYHRFMTDLFRYLAFMPDAGPSWTIDQFDWDRDPRRLDLMESLYSGSNPDLRRFKARGGKLLAYQGWADQSVLPLNVIDYYETAEKTMGGRAATQEFFRLFMIPGMNHCAGGEGAHAVDYLSYLEAWVERGEAPDMMLAAQPKPDAPQRPQYGAPALAPEQAAFTRPLYPYPLQPRYKGRGDTGDAASYEPRQPPRPAATR